MKGKLYGEIDQFLRNKVNKEKYDFQEVIYTTLDIIRYYQTIGDKQ